MNVIKIFTLSELSDVIFNYWVDLIENGNPEVLFTTESSSLAKLANMITFIDRRKEFKIFSKEEDYQLARANSLKSIERRLLGNNIFISNHSYGGKGCYFQEVFGKRINERDFMWGAKWCGEYSMIYFYNRCQYQENPLNQERIDPDKLKNIIQWHPGGPTLCVKNSGDYWRIIANIV